MTKNLLTIFCRLVEDDRCRLFLPYWQKSGCDLLFNSPVLEPSQLSNVNHFVAGKIMGWRADNMYHLQERCLMTFKHCLTLPYEGFWFTQYDSICLAPLPVLGPDDSMHNICGGPHPSFSAPFILHPPWGFGKNRMKEFVEAAEQHSIESEKGFMDMWLGWIIDLHKIPFQHIEKCWTTNAIETPEQLQSARQAIKDGYIFVHGIKNGQTLNQLLAP